MMTRQTYTKHSGEGHRKRLRQRFIDGGLEGFHDYEVIELLLSLNTPRKDCKESAKALLKQFKTFQAVMEARPRELEKIDGVGPSNSLGIKLIKAVADRYLRVKIHTKDVVKNPGDLIDYLQHAISHKKKEVFVCVFLDAKNQVIESEILFQGTLTTSSVYPREVIIKALGYHAAAVIFAHNHPSGDCKPSNSDIQITKKLYFALRFVGIVVHEHLIMGEGCTFSLAENGFISSFNNEFNDQNG